MKTKKFLTVFFSLALVFCLAVSLIAQPKTIKIGAIYPLTGNLATTGLDCKRGVEMAVEIINGKYDLNLPLAKTEGLPNLGGAKIEVIFGDSKGDPRNGMAEAERLVTQEKVVAVIGAYQSAVTKTASQATERLKIPFVNSDSTSPTLTERGFKYFFRPECTDTIFARDQFEFLKDLKKKTGQKLESVALLYENTEWGANVGKEEQNMRRNSSIRSWRISPIPKCHRRHQRSGEADQGQTGCAPSCLLYHGCHPLSPRPSKRWVFRPKGF